MPRFCASLSIALLALIIAACSSDRPPAGAVEGELSVAMTLGKFDPNYGRIGETILFVTINGKKYRLVSREGSEVIGFDEVQRLTELGGRRVLVAGEIDGDTYYASYTELLPDEKSDEFSLFEPNT